MQRNRQMVEMERVAVSKGTNLNQGLLTRVVIKTLDNSQALRDLHRARERSRVQTKAQPLIISNNLVQVARQHSGIERPFTLFKL